MSEEQRNYGIEPEPEFSGSGGSGTGIPSSPGTMSPNDENTWSVVSHLTIFLNLFTGFLGPVASFIIWLVYKNRSPRVSFHALQSLWYQVAWIAILAVGWDGLRGSDRRADRLPAVPADVNLDVCSLRPRCIRRLHGQPGGRLPVSLGGGRGQRRAQSRDVVSGNDRRRRASCSE